MREETPRASRDQAMTRGTELRRARSATRAAHTTRAHSRAQSIQEDRPPAVLAFAHLVSFCINRVGLSARRRRRRHQVGRHQIDHRRWHWLVRCRRIDVGNLPELPAAAALLCGCRSWLPAATALGSSSVVTSSATGCCWLCCCLSGVTLARGVGLRWRHFLLGRRSHRADLHNPIDLCQGALPLGHVFVEASTTRGHGEFWRDADAATVACQKSGIYPTFDSAARLAINTTSTPRTTTARRAQPFSPKLLRRSSSTSRPVDDWLAQ